MKDKTLDVKLKELHELAATYHLEYINGEEDIDAVFALEALMKFSYGEDYYDKLLQD